MLGVNMLEEPQRRLRYLEQAEEVQLLAVSSPLLRALITIGTNTGIRIKAEGLTLKWTDVDLSRNLLTVQAAYSKNGQTRNIPVIAARVRPSNLSKQRATAPTCSATRMVSPTDHSKSHSSRPVKTPGGRIRRVPHTLRHTFASSLVMAGVDLRTVQEYGGWSDLSLVQRYSHLSASHRRKPLKRSRKDSTTRITTAPVPTKSLGLQYVR